MSNEISGAYSPNVVYGQLTMPFANKPVKINAHTPYDKVDSSQQTFSKADFNNNNAKMRVSVEDIHNAKGIELNDNLVNDLFNDDKAEFPPKSLNHFQSSSYRDNSDVVHTALKNGYTADQAVNAAKAYKAYAKASAYDPTNPVQNLASKNFVVS